MCFLTEAHPDNICHALQTVIHDDREPIGGETVSSPDHEVAKSFSRFPGECPETPVRKRDWLRINPEADGPGFTTSGAVSADPRVDRRIAPVDPMPLRDIVPRAGAAKRFSFRNQPGGGFPIGVKPVMLPQHRFIGLKTEAAECLNNLLTGTGNIPRGRYPR